MVKYFREHKNISVSEIDEELTNLNGGKYPDDSKQKQKYGRITVYKIINCENVIFFTNTDCFTHEDITEMRKKGFKIAQLRIDRDELERRNRQRVEKEGYADMTVWLTDMLECQKEIKDKGLVDIEIDATLATNIVASTILSLVN